MEMIFHLDADIFTIVANGTKNVEVRVNDEKRQKLKVGDTLIFLKRPEETQKITAQVTDLVYYKSFSELINDYPIERVYLPGYHKKDFINLLKRFYTKEDQDKYGVVAIHFQIKDVSK